MSDCDEFAAWLGACYDEAERDARQALDAKPVSEPRYPAGGDLMTSAVALGLFHARNNPAHRLADIALKRAILALHAVETQREQRRALAEDIAAGKPLWWYEDVHVCVICGWFDSATGGCDTVRQLGTEFSGRPGYRQEWRP